MLNDSFREAGDICHIVNIRDFVFPEEFNSVEVLDIPINCFFGVVGFSSNIRCEVAFEIEGDDFLFVSDRAAKVMDITPCWQNFAGFFLEFPDILRDDSVTTAKKCGQIELC